MARQKPIGVRGRSTSLSPSLVRGREAELHAAEFFLRRGHAVTDLADQRCMHDLEVSGYGRVQVKRAYLVHHHRPALVKQVHTRWKVKLDSGNTGRRYPVDAWDWLCIVFVFQSSPRFIVMKAASCVVQGTDYMKAALSMTKDTAAKRWQALEPVAAIWESGKEAGHAEALPE